MKLSIAVVQFEIAHQDSKKNFQRIEDFIERAKSEAQVIIFPEDCITGSIFGDLSKLDVDNSVRKTFQGLASRYQIDIVTGSCMERTPEGNFNTSYYINSKGDVLGTYRKNHLYPSEHSFLKPGTEAPVFDTAFGRAGIVICWDMLFPEIFQRMKDRGVQLIYCPSYWYKEIAGSLSRFNSESEEGQIDALCLTRALETNCALVYANAAGIQRYVDSSKDTLIGHSQIVMPGIGAIERLNHNQEEMFIHEIDLSVLDESRKIYQY